MATEAKVRTASEAVLTDIRPGKTRKTIYTPAGQLGPMLAFALGIGAVAVAPGVARWFTGSSPRMKARENLEDELLAAKVTGEKAKAEEIRAKIALVAREFDPVSEEERALKLKAIRSALGFEAAQEEISLDKERAATARADELFPLVREERTAALRIQEQLAGERAERHVEFLKTEAARRDLIAEETERQDLLNRQLEQQNTLIAAAIGPLDQAQAAQFARERLFPPSAPKPPAFIGALSRPGTSAGAGF